MSGAAIALLVVSLVVVWGGLIVSIIALARRPERTDWPDGSEHEGGPDHPTEHNT